MIHLMSSMDRGRVQGRVPQVNGLIIMINAIIPDPGEYGQELSTCGSPAASACGRLRFFSALCYCCLPRRDECEKKVSVTAVIPVAYSTVARGPA